MILTYIDFMTSPFMMKKDKFTINTGTSGTSGTATGTATGTSGTATGTATGTSDKKIINIVENDDTNNIIVIIYYVSSTLFGLFISIYAVYLSVNCRWEDTEPDTLSTVFFAIFAFLFGFLYLIYYFLFNYAGRRCKIHTV